MMIHNVDEVQMMIGVRPSGCPVATSAAYKGKPHSMRSKSKDYKHANDFENRTLT